MTKPRPSWAEQCREYIRRNHPNVAEAYIADAEEQMGSEYWVFLFGPKKRNVLERLSEDVLLYARHSGELKP